MVKLPGDILPIKLAAQEKQETAKKLTRWGAFLVWAKNPIKSFWDIVKTVPFIVVWFGGFRYWFLENYFSQLAPDGAWIITASLFMFFVGFVYYTWGEHFPVGKKKNGFWLLSIIVIIFCLLRIILTDATFLKERPTPKPPSAGVSEYKVPPRDVGWMSWEVTSKPTEFIRAYEGDKFEYRTPKGKGFWLHHEDGNEYYCNPSTTPGQERFFHFFNMMKGGEKIKIFGNGSFQMSFRVFSKG